MKRLQHVVAVVGLFVVATGFTAAASAASAAGSAPPDCSPAPKNSDVALTIDSPVEGAVIGAPAVQVSGIARHDGLIPGRSVTGVTVRVTPCADGIEAPAPSAALKPGSDNRYAWDTSFSWNGPFLVTVTAQGTQSQESIRHQKFSLAVPPVAPSGVKASPDKQQKVAVSWAKNPEPDIVLYEVRRAAKGDRSFTTVAQTTSTLTTLTDDPPSGDWRYVVIAIRRGAQETEGLSSDASGEAAVTLTSPTTTAAAQQPGAGGATATTAASGGQSAGGAPAAGPAGAAGAPSANNRAGKVDLSGFAAMLDAQRQPPRRLEETDPGFAETLPFKQQDEPALGSEDAQQELGTNRPNQGVGQRIIDNLAERRRSMSFVAFGSLLFVVSMMGLWLRGEVSRADELDALDPDQPLIPAAASLNGHAGFGDLVEPGVAMVAVSHRRTRRDAEASAPIDSPGLDVYPSDSSVASSRQRTRVRSTDARRTTTVVSSRSANDRRQGGAAVRARRGRSGQGDRRIPVG
jgi:hypothetical protein